MHSSNVEAYICRFYASDTLTAGEVLASPDLHQFDKRLSSHHTVDQAVCAATQPAVDVFDAVKPACSPLHNHEMRWDAASPKVTTARDAQTQAPKLSLPLLDLGLVYASSAASLLVQGAYKCRVTNICMATVLHSIH